MCCAVLCYVWYLKDCIQRHQGVTRATNKGGNCSFIHPSSLSRSLDRLLLKSELLHYTAVSLLFRLRALS
jgi:hypothetical protein